MEVVLRHKLHVGEDLTALELDWDVEGGLTFMELREGVKVGMLENGHGACEEPLQVDLVLDELVKVPVQDLLV